jgi:N-acetyl sugar amidotransferase
VPARGRQSLAARDPQVTAPAPSEIRYCARCVISNQRPRIRFDTEGVCSACRFAERKALIDWTVRERELRQLLDRHRSRDGSFDVVVPGSGGKDSGYVAHQLKYVYGMHPLTVTWAPHMYTDVGRRNFQAFVDAGFHNIMGTPDGKVHATLTRLALEHMGDPFQPFVYGVKSLPIRIATAFRIPLVMYGENGEVEYGGDDKNEDKATHDIAGDLLKHYWSGIGPMEWTKFGVSAEDLLYYMPPPPEEIERVGVQCHFFSYYKRWIPQENYYYCIDNIRFTPNPDGRSEGTYSKYASIDDKVDGFHYYLGFIKFGIGRATSDAAHEIRDGHLTREEGVALVRRYDGEFPSKYFADFLSYTGLSEDEFREIVDRYRSPHIWSKQAGGWRLRSQVS